MLLSGEIRAMIIEGSRRKRMVISIVPRFNKRI
jgi:hypothetical protein